ncbi:MAG: nucleoside hydrolase [Planctomycetota bacterium]|jgi:inosine-uridine nucleoside N-ribohydrolase
MTLAFHEEDSGPPLVIDTDMGLDDVRALLALVPAKAGAIQGILSVEGSASLEKGTENLLGLVHALGMAKIPVIRGAAKPWLTPPPWRPRADKAGGLVLAETLNFEARTDILEKLPAILARHSRTLHYLALGPLGNLEAIEQKSPGALKRLHTLWIPVDSFEKGSAVSWNLTWDGAAAEQVLESPVNAVLIDLSSAGKIDANRLFSSLAESGQGSPMIMAMAGELEKQGHPSFLYDELAATAFLAPELIEIEEERWRFDKIVSDRIMLAPDRQGSIRIARFLDGEASLKVLKAAWESPSGAHTPLSHGHPLGEGIMHTHSPSLKDRIKAFHGHLGPYVVIGYRMGRIALRETGSKGHFDLNAQVYTQPKPPPSCLIDGVQLGSGCTMGKGNITATEIDGPAYAIFTSDDGKRSTLRLRPEIPVLIKRLVDEQGVEAAGEYFIMLEEPKLFEIETE